MPTFRPTMGVLARASDRFACALFAPLADRYDVELLDAPGPAVDLLWCDWADEALLAAGQEPAGPPIIARLHRHELFAGQRPLEPMSAACVRLVPDDEAGEMDLRDLRCVIVANVAQAGSPAPWALTVHSALQAP